MLKCRKKNMSYLNVFRNFGKAFLKNTDMQHSNALAFVTRRLIGHRQKFETFIMSHFVV